MINAISLCELIQEGVIMNEKTVYIPAINCGHCLMAIKRELGYIKGVESVEGGIDAKKVTVVWSDPASWDTISATLSEIGYPPED